MHNEKTNLSGYILEILAKGPFNFNAESDPHKKKMDPHPDKVMNISLIVFNKAELLNFFFLNVRLFLC